MDQQIHNSYTDEEKYIQSESSEINLGQSQYLDRIFGFFPALENRNYKLYFSGQLISLIGTWLQIVAEAYLVYTLTHSAFWVGLVTALATIPTLFLSLIGGVIVDMFPKRKIMLFTQGSSMILALLYGILALTHINVLEIAVLAFLLGIVTAVDTPARQVLVSEILTQEQLPSGIALNSGAFNTARVIGPAVAGFLIALVKPGGAFLLNGFSYTAVLFALYLMRLDEKVIKRNLHPLNAIKEGIVYAYTHPLIRVLLIFAGVVSIFGWSYSTLMPVMADRIFHVGPSGLGYLYSAAGIGALMATFAIAGFAKKFSPLIFIIGGNFLFAVAIFFFTFTSNFEVALLLLFFGGLGLLSCFAMLNTTIQHAVTDDVRGRVMSIYALMFLGLSPLGNFEIGWLSEKFGTANGIRFGAVIVFLFGLVVLFNRKKIIASYKAYKMRSA